MYLAGVGNRESRAAREGCDSLPGLGRYRRVGATDWICGLVVAAGFFLYGPRVLAGPYDRDLPSIQDVSFVGNKNFGADVLRQQMLLRFPSLLHPLRSRPRFRRNTFPKELRRVEDFYRRQGFGGASAWLDSIIATEHGGSVRLRVRVREGPRTLIGEIRFLPQPVFSLDELRRVMPFAPNDPYPFKAAIRGRATRALRLAFLSRGYLAVRVWDNVVLQPDSTRVRLEYGMEPGPQFTIRNLDVSGNVHTRRDLVLRELRIKPGEVYSYTRVQESQQGLYSTSLFRSVAIREDSLDLEKRTVDLTVHLVERSMAFVEGSVGIGRRDEFEARISGGWGHRNLFGRGHALEARSTLAYNLERKGNNYFAEQRLLYKQPHLFGSQILFSPELAYVIDQRQENVELRRLQLNAQASRKVGRFSTVALGAIGAFTTTTLQDEQVTDDLLQTRALSASVTRNSSDDLFSPRRGGVQSLSVQRAGFGGDNHFSRSTATYVRYLPVGRHVLAFGVRTGWVESFGKSRQSSAADIGIQGVPFEYLYQAGGNTTVRGFANNSLGSPVRVVRRVSGSVAGIDVVDLDAGTVLLIGNLELRSPFPWIGRQRLGMVLFLDAGNTWAGFQAFRDAAFGLRFDSSYRSADMRYSYGFGLRYRTPVGPVRLDVGFPLKSFGRRNFHLGLGHTF